jgi:hypothetical protein
VLSAAIDGIFRTKSTRLHSLHILVEGVFEVDVNSHSQSQMRQWCSTLTFLSVPAQRGAGKWTNSSWRSDRAARLVFWVEEFWGNVGRALRAGYFRQGFVWVVLVAIGVVVTGIEPSICSRNPPATVVLPMQAAKNIAVGNDSVSVKGAPSHVQVDHSIVRNVDDVRIGQISCSWCQHCC